MKIEDRPIDRIVPYARNPRRNESAVDKVAASIKEFGFRQPIVVDESGVIIAGHTRFQAARRLNLTEVPVHVASGLTPQQVKAYRIADNRTADESEFDYELLRLELEEIENRESTGFDGYEINNLLEEIFNPDEEYQDMPEFDQKQIKEESLIVYFPDMQTKSDFSAKVGQTVNPETRFVWYPKESKPKRQDIKNIIIERE